MDFSGDRARTIIAMLTARAWKDEAFRKKLVSDPKAVLKEEGVDVPADLTIQVVEDGPKVKYVSITPDFRTHQDPQKVVAFMKRVFPIPEGMEVRLVQSTDKVRYLVISHPPSGVQPGTMADAELMSLVGGSSPNVSTNVEEAVEGVTTEVGVTETTEAQDAETTTTVVAEAELVAT
jgi:hypothetical protein